MGRNATLKGQEINEFIIANHLTLSTREIAVKFETKPTNINSRKQHLKRLGKLEACKKKLSKIDKAYKKAEAKMELDKAKAEIKKHILANYGKKTNEDIAKELNLSTVKGYVASLKRSGELSSDLKALKGDKPTKKLKNNTYTNANGVNKALARVKMVSGVEASGVTGTILSLPHVGCTIEKMIGKITKGNDFIGCEMDKPTFNGMRRTVKQENLPIQMHFGMIADKIYGVDSDTYAHMILDYCGMLPTFDKELRYAFDNDLVKVGGTISITFSKRGHSDPNNVIKKLANVPNNFPDTRCEMERGVEAYFNKLVGWDYELDEIFSYKDDGKGAMMLVRVKRIK